MMFEVLRVVHVGAGSLALGISAMPLLTRKGGRWHVRFGRTYVGAMATVSLTAWGMSALRLLDPETSPSREAMSVFLAFVALLAGASAWHGVRALRDPRRHRPRAGVPVVDVAWGAALLVAALGTIGFGLGRGSALLTWFPLIGVFLGADQLRHWLRPPREPRHWWFAHMTGMFSSVISTVTAFVVFAVPRLVGEAARSPSLWLAPTAVLVPVLLAWQRRYRRRFARAPASG